MYQIYPELPPHKFFQPIQEGTPKSDAKKEATSVERQVKIAMQRIENRIQQEKVINIQARADATSDALLREEQGQKRDMEQADRQNNHHKYKGKRLLADGAYWPHQTGSAKRRAQEEKQAEKQLCRIRGQREEELSLPDQEPDHTIVVAIGRENPRHPVPQDDGECRLERTTGPPSP